MTYKCCAVPVCTNTTIKTPKKLFICVPKNEKMRKKWLQLARRNPSDIMDSTVIYFCEDHFDIEKDMANYLQYKMGFSLRIIMVNGVLPTKFHCQLDRRRRSITNTSRPAFVKRQRTQLIKECEAALQNTTTALEDLSEGNPTKLNRKLNCRKRSNANNFMSAFVKRKKKQLIVECERLHQTETVAEVSSEGSLSYIQPTATAAVEVKSGDVHSCYSGDSLPEGSRDEVPVPDCSVCTKAITGLVFVCVQCNVRVCGACDARGHHAQHYVLRAPIGSSEEELREVVARVREAVSSAGVRLEPQGDEGRSDESGEDSCSNGNLEFKTEIKLEADVEDEDPLGSVEYEDPYQVSAPGAGGTQVVPEQNEVKLEKLDSPASTGHTASHKQTRSTSPSSPPSSPAPPTDSDDSQPPFKRRHVSGDSAGLTLSHPTHTPRTQAMKPDRTISTSDPNADPGSQTVAASLSHLKKQ